MTGPGGRPVREASWSIGGPRLFGVTTEPAAGPAAGRPWVVLLNAGAAYRAGPNRLYVELARALAARGVPCLRLDLGGLGDSPAPDPARENDSYPATAFADIDRAVRRLGRDRGARRVVLAGLCSGAYFAFQAAAQMTSPVLAEALVINPLTFHWREGMSLEAPAAKQVQATHYYLTAALRPRKWLRLLLGRTRIGVRGAARLLLNRWRLARRPNRTATGEPANRPPRHREHADVPGDLARIVRRERKVTFFFARSDPGPWLLRVAARRAVARLRRAGHLRVITIDGADHTFSRRAPRHALAAAVAAHLAERYLRPAG